MKGFVYFLLATVLGAAMALTSSAGLANTQGAYFAVSVRVLPRCGTAKLEMVAGSRSFLVMNCTKGVGYSVNLDAGSYSQAGAYQTNGVGSGILQRIPLGAHAVSLERSQPANAAQHVFLTINY